MTTTKTPREQLFERLNRPDVPREQWIEEANRLLDSEKPISPAKRDGLRKHWAERRSQAVQTEPKVVSYRRLSEPGTGDPKVIAAQIERVQKLCAELRSRAVYNALRHG